VDPRPIPEVLHLLQVVDQIPPHPKLLAAFCYLGQLGSLRKNVGYAVPSRKSISLSVTRSQIPFHTNEYEKKQWTQDRSLRYSTYYR
jgi:hypothetical protein